MFQFGFMMYWGMQEGKIEALLQRIISEERLLILVVWVEKEHWKQSRSWADTNDNVVNFRKVKNTFHPEKAQDKPYCLPLKGNRK